MLKEIPAKVYQAISFEKDGSPDFDLLASCFIEQGIFINNKGDNPVIRSVPAYIDMISSAMKSGIVISIKEVELSNSVQKYGRVAQISSEYQLRFEGQKGIETRYGVNLFQLVYQNDHWLISSMCWDDRVDKSLLALNA
ncbi:MAG: hypothetical protein CSH37_06310 [Thalassolituus sp.]|jgi:hypothetical protein|nr:MAG: hypothetical protein CSH37_06310 [Thalassolituus sp.]|tara:strand:+ start:1273 stop:1689 length:417 start_codon:yes stop_codon:yes gene_type:complete